MDVAERVVLGYVAAGAPVLPRNMAASFGASPAKGFVVGDAEECRRRSLLLRSHTVEALLLLLLLEDVKAFCLINAFKYVWRSKTHKDETDVNVRKAIWFLERSLNHE